MSSESARTIEYDDKKYRALLHDFKSLSTYGVVAAWDNRARDEVSRIVGVLQKLDAEIVRETHVLEQARSERATRPFLRRTFTNRKPEKEAENFIEQCHLQKTTLEALAAKLHEAIDFTPNSPEEKKILLKELRLRKKHLQFQKRELAANMKEIRADARVKSAQAGRGFLGMYDSKLAADQRRRLRYAKEAALAPHEDAKAAIERQIIQVDKDIAWVDGFGT